MCKQYFICNVLEGMFVICLHTQFHTYILNGPSVTATKPKAKHRRYALILCCCILCKNYQKVNMLPAPVTMCGFWTIYVVALLSLYKFLRPTCYARFHEIQAYGLQWHIVHNQFSENRSPDLKIEMRGHRWRCDLLSQYFL
jgi:hypothetical protein